MTAARRPGFDPAVWNGDKPLVEPQKVTFNVGDLVALTEPLNPDGEPAVKGVVISVDPDRDTGEIVLTIARERIKPPTGKYTEIRWDFRYEQHPASLVDEAWHVPSTVFRRDMSNGAAARICMAVGARHLAGGHWSREDRLLIGAALVLSDLEHRGQAS